MSIAEAARLLGRSREYLYAGLREGRFPGAKFGRAWGISRAFVSGFLAEVVAVSLSMSFEDYAQYWLAQHSNRPVLRANAGRAS
jgi:excisionase family DNA binding protein